ncbi:acetyl-CoA C-acyltransferase [Conexibacter arvalis]|uniref:Probable acetyl-CoA acetyltransferase n=1 Tax=Conexibacter arvalis TaxID=912552 RepID=A0A840IJF2_9ACTN|nr:acetyl-CoA C-acyltransferase [Conexibacter arvalis]MBB4664303.1 acetyl-CoA C-acetyltransferase [Conexibacter arvalis]
MSAADRRTVVLGCARTAIGRLGGALAAVPAPQLGAVAIRGALDRAGVAPGQVEHVVAGTVVQAGQGSVPSRQAQLAAGIPDAVSSETVNKACASGLRAAAIADQAIRGADADVVVAAGMESMSRAPHLLPDMRFGLRKGDAEVLDALLRDALRSPWSGRTMYEEATAVADRLGIERARLDAWALRSHERAIAAADAGATAEEIVPVAVPARLGETVVERDESPRRDTSLAALSALPGLVGRDGSHTAGNSPGVNDGAAALVLASDRWARANGREPLATVVGHAQVAGDTGVIATVPAEAAAKALARAGIAAADVDLWEINEAFASVTVHSTDALGIDPERVNVNGGAVALGHPVGASGARIVGALVHELRRRGGGLGVAAICSAGGQGDALIVRV